MKKKMKPCGALRDPNELIIDSDELARRTLETAKQRPYRHPMCRCQLETVRKKKERESAEDK